MELIESFVRHLSSLKDDNGKEFFSEEEARGIVECSNEDSIKKTLRGEGPFEAEVLGAYQRIYGTEVIKEVYRLYDGTEECLPILVHNALNNIDRDEIEALKDVYLEYQLSN